MKKSGILMITVMLLVLTAASQPGQYQVKKCMDKESLANDEWNSCDFLLYFYETEKRFKITIHKPDSTENEQRIIAEISVSKRKKSDLFGGQIPYYTYRGTVDGSNYQIMLKKDKLQHYCTGKVDEGAVTITAEFDGVPFFQVFWCEKIIKNEEFRTFDDL